MKDVLIDYKIVGISDEKCIYFVVESPFGCYVQKKCTESKSNDIKGCWIPPNINAGSITLAQSIELFNFPKNIGVNSDTNEPVLIHLRQSGAVITTKIMIDGSLRHISFKVPSECDIFALSLDDAISMIPHNE